LRSWKNPLTSPIRPVNTKSVLLNIFSKPHPQHPALPLKNQSREAKPFTRRDLPPLISTHPQAPQKNACPLP
jgi:hypothetical protein